MCIRDRRRDHGRLRVPVPRGWPVDGRRSNDRRGGVSRMSRILVVDDDEANRATLERILEREGYEVGHASTGRDALEAIRAHPVDVVLTDLKMPGMSGIDLLK